MYSILSMLTVVFHSISSALGFLYLYLHRKISTIQKHPGPLIYHQILILSLFSTFKVIYYTVQFISFTCGLSAEDIVIYSRIQVVLDYYCLMNLICYQLFLGIEVFAKSLFLRLKKWYVIRVKIYHYLSHLIPLISCAVFYEAFLEDTDYKQYIVHAMIPGILILLALIFIYGIQYSLENLEKCPRKRQCNNLVSYLKNILYIKTMTILSCFIKLVYDHMEQSEENLNLKIGIYVFYYMLDWLGDILIIYSRIWQSHTYTYLKDLLKSSKTRTIRRSRYKQHTEIDDTASAEVNSTQNGKAIKWINEASDKTVTNYIDARTPVYCFAIYLL